MLNNLDICLERKEIDVLPITPIKSNLIPILGYTSTATETWYIEV